MAWNLTDEHIRLAQETEQKYGVPASVTLGQFITESAAGTSKLFQKSNNGFGIIGSYNGQSVWQNDRYWRVYPSLEASFDDHGRLLSSGVYAEATKGAQTVEEYIDSFIEIYAPSSDGNAGYPKLLKQVIKDNNLTQYDGQWQGKGASLTGSSSVSATNTVNNSGGVLSNVLGTVVKVIAFLFLFFLAVVFFMQAFEVPSPKEAIKKSVVKKAVEE